MARVCELTGKKGMMGYNVSKSNSKTKKKFNPNLQYKSFYIPEENEWIRLRVSCKAIKTINKNGITAALNKLGKKGRI